MRSDKYENGSTGGKAKNYRYAAIALCCVAVLLIAAVYTVRANPQWIARWDDRTLNLENDMRNAGGDLTRGVPDELEQKVVKQVPTVDSKDNRTGKNSDAAKQGQENLLTKPLEGKVSKKFALEEPVYSKTLDQYTVHAGIDMDAPMDTPVVAAAEGTVTKVYNDDKMGLTIEITHANGLITKYSNLSTDKMVGESDVVKAGDVISGVGNSALFESIEPTHLHFEVWKDGVAVDPERYFK